MPNTDVPPWLSVTPDYFLNAIRAGAQAGLERSGQQYRAQEGADRLRLAYDQMGAEQQREDQAAQAKLTLAQQAMQLRQSNFEEQMALRQQHQEDLNKYREDVMGWRTKSEEDRAALQQAELQRKLDLMKQGKVHFGPQGEVLRENPDGTVETLRERDPRDAKPMKLSDVQRGMMNADLASLRGVDKQLNEWKARGVLPHLLSPGKQAELTAQRDELVKRILQYEPDETKRENLRKELMSGNTAPQSAPTPAPSGVTTGAPWAMPSDTGGTSTGTSSGVSLGVPWANPDMKSEKPKTKSRGTGARILVRRKSDGKQGYLDESDFDPDKYEKADDLTQPGLNRGNIFDLPTPQPDRRTSGALMPGYGLLSTSSTET